MPRFVEAALTGRPLVVHGDGGQVRSFIHVADAVRAILDLMASPAAVAGVFNIGGEEPVTLLELAQRVGAAAKPGSSIELRPYPDTLGRAVRGRPPPRSRSDAGCERRSAFSPSTISTPRCGR